MTYTTVAKVQARLMNANLGVASAVTYDDTAIAEAIAEADDAINFELDITTNTTNTAYTGMLNKIAIDIVAMYILQAKHFKENNEVEGVANYWSTTPDFTFMHKQKLRRIHRKIHGSSWSKSMVTGGNVF